MRQSKILILMGWLLGISFVAKADPLDDKILKSYLTIANDLANDSSQNISLQAKEIFNSINTQKDKKDVEIYKKIAASSQNISVAKSIEETRSEFKLLSEEMKNWFEKEKPSTVDLIFCPMKKAHWLQIKGEAVRNPYYGKSMLSCGYSVTKKLK